MSPKPGEHHTFIKAMSMHEEEAKLLKEECQRLLKGKELERVDKILVKLSPEFKKHLVDFLKEEKHKNPEHIKSAMLKKIDDAVAKKKSSKP